MAERYATKSGVWSDVTVWDGGSTLPTTGDVAHASAYTVQIDQSISVDAISTAAGATASNGGEFVVDSTAVAPITIDLALGIRVADHTSTGGGTSSRKWVLNILNTAPKVTLNADVIGGDGDYQVAVGVAMTSSGPDGGADVELVINGNVTGKNTGAYGLHMGDGDVTIVGDVTGADDTAAYGLYVAGGTVTVTGDVTGGSSSSAFGLYVASSAQVRVDGLARASLTAAGVSGGTQSIPVAIKGAVNHPQGMNAVTASMWTAWDANEFVWTAYTDSAWPDPEGSLAYLTRFGTDLPEQADVRRDTAYGPGDTLVGTLDAGASLSDITAAIGAQIAAATNADD